MLGSLRFANEATRGRRYPEPRHPYRGEFVRDRDRVIHSRAFRRLEAKTQVFAAGVSDHFRNRLTHTIEVTQIARTVASALELNPDLVEALSLVHDIGHPPFAHAGESELNRQMQRFSDHFDHNEHALRIVEHFEQTYPRFPGLNLCFEVREGILKHSRDLPTDSPFAEYLPFLRPPLEAQLIDLADEIAYNAADLDDGMSAGLIDLGDLAAEVPAFAAIHETVETQFPGATEHEQYQECLRAVIDRMVSGLIEGTVHAAQAAQVSCAQEVREYRDRLACFTPDCAAMTLQLKRFLHSRVYASETIEQDRLSSTRRIAAMFEYFEADPARLPAGYAEEALSAPPHRVICDYITGMTDFFFDRTFSSLPL
jgi:dGTPase